MPRQSPPMGGRRQRRPRHCRYTEWKQRRQRWWPRRWWHPFHYASSSQRGFRSWLRRRVRRPRRQSRRAWRPPCEPPLRGSHQRHHHQQHPSLVARCVSSQPERPARVRAGPCVSFHCRHRHPSPRQHRSHPPLLPPPCPPSQHRHLRQFAPAPAPPQQTTPHFPSAVPPPPPRHRPRRQSRELFHSQRRTALIVCTADTLAFSLLPSLRVPSWEPVPFCRRQAQRVRRPRSSFLAGPSQGPLPPPSPLPLPSLPSLPLQRVASGPRRGLPAAKSGDNPFRHPRRHHHHRLKWRKGPWPHRGGH